MLQPHPCAESVAVASEELPRARQLNIFYSLKEKNHFISRQVLYLAIAVLDKYAAVAPSSGFSQAATETGMHVRAAAALWIAWKFLENEHIPLAKLVARINGHANLKEEILEMEVEILQAIDFEVPSDFAYASLVRAYKSLQKQGTDEKTVVSQCLAFLKEGLRQSSDFSLCAQLGTAILHLVQSRSVQDRRIKEVCAIIYSKKNKTKKPSSKSAEEILTS